MATNTLVFESQTITDDHIFGGVSYLADLNVGEEFTIGNTASASVEFVTDIQLPLYTKDATNGRFSSTQYTDENIADSMNDILVTDDNSVFAIDTPRGRFFITEVTKEDGFYTVTAYDAMILLETNVSALSLTFPLTVSAAASAIATYIGCTVSGTIYNGSLTVSALDDNMTIRELLGYVAEASGCSVKIDGSDHLCFMYYEDSGITLTASDYKKINIADYSCTAIDRVTIFDSYGNLKAEAGTGDNALYIQGNPFLEEAQTAAAQAILDNVSGIVYTPLTCELFDEEGLEIGTMATFGTTQTLIMHLESSESGAMAQSVGSDTRAEYNKSVDIVASEARVLAEAALETAENTDQYFWMASTGSDTGVHITEIPREDFIADPQNGGGNLVAKSSGITVRDGMTALAVFGPTTRIGKSNSYRTEVDSDGFRLIDDKQTNVLEVIYSGEERANTKELFKFSARSAGPATTVTATRKTKIPGDEAVTYRIVDARNDGEGTTTRAIGTFTLTTGSTSTVTKSGANCTFSIEPISWSGSTATVNVVMTFTLAAAHNINLRFTAPETYYVPALSFLGITNFSDEVYTKDKKITYDAGDTITNTVWYGAGFLTSSSTEIYFTLPIARIITATSVTVTSLTITTRQAGNYTHGSTSSNKVEWTPIAATITPSGVRISASRSTTTNAVNNDVIGINAQISLEFS